MSMEAARAGSEARELYLAEGIDAGVAEADGRLKVLTGRVTLDEIGSEMMVP